MGEFRENNFKRVGSNLGKTLLKKLFDRREVINAFFCLKVDYECLCLTFVEIENWLRPLLIDLHTLSNDVHFVVIADHKRNVAAIITATRVFLRKKRFHEVAITVDMCDVVIPIAFGAHTPTHEFLEKDVVSVNKVKD